MDFFKPVVDEEKLHINFKKLYQDEQFRYERQEFQEWAEGFIDRDNKIIKEFQISFNSVFWEVYLFAVFKKYQFQIDWSYSSPDFILKHKNIEFVIEATTANAAQSKPNEWDKEYTPEEVKEVFKDLNKMNFESIIRLSNAIIAKWKHYKAHYKTLTHVKNKPFVIAVGPFEQPYFYNQFNRPIVALLYDNYVDEQAQKEHPKLYPTMAPSRSLGSVKKENGSEVILGFFNNENMSDVSAVIFSNSATWGKVAARAAYKYKQNCLLAYMWLFNSNEQPVFRVEDAKNFEEFIPDGLQIYHNPFAKNPLPLDIFRRKGVIQYSVDNNGESIIESDDALLIRTMQLNLRE